METQETPKPQLLSDVGTRGQHLLDHCESLEAVVEILKKRGAFSPADKERLIKLTVAAEVLKLTLDTYVGVNDKGNEFKLYQLLKDIPKDAASIEGGRGTPLKCQE
jgi:hypothetical protein